MKTYVVAGGAGFLGSHMVDALIDKGERVICLDNLLTGLERNFEHLKENKQFQFKRTNISQPITISEPVDFVLNYACPASPFDYRKYARETMLACSDGVRNLLELSKEKNARFLQTSTSEVYGDPSVHPQKESYWGNVNPYGERSCYDEGKRFAEAMIYIYKKDIGVDTSIVRIFNTYGPRMKASDGRVVSTFINQALQNEDITIFGDGSQTRSFCFVEDQVEGQLRLIHSDESEPINIGNGGEFTMIELAKEVIELTDSSSKLVFKPLPSDDPTQRKPDITKAKELLDWEPKVPLREGLIKTINWYKKEIGK